MCVSQLFNLISPLSEVWNVTSVDSTFELKFYYDSDIHWNCSVTTVCSNKW